MKNNKKGFTLIELLAVIVVLAIIMVIATGTITDALNKSKTGAWDDSCAMIKKQFKSNIVASYLTEGGNAECSGDTCHAIYGTNSVDYPTFEIDLDNGVYTLTVESGDDKSKFGKGLKCELVLDENGNTVTTATTTTTSH